MRIIALCLLSVGFLFPPAWAAPRTQVELVNLSPEVQAGQTIQLGLKFKCDEHFHIYWKNVGDAGTAPTVTWKDSPHLRFDSLIHPGPILFDQKGVINFVHAGETILVIPTKLASDTPKEVRLEALVEWLECDEAGCYPQEKNVSLTLKVGEKNPVAAINLKKYPDFNPPINTTGRIKDQDLFVDSPPSFTDKVWLPERGFISAWATASALSLPNNLKKFSLKSAPEELKSGPITFIAEDQTGTVRKINVTLTTTPVENASTPSTGTPDSLNWQPWSPEAQATALAQGKIVYLDFTARWCATCQVNKRVYHDSVVVDKFNKNEIVLLRADWTKKNPVIAAELKKYQREGIPLNLILKSQREPIILSEALTAGEVIAAIDAVVLNQSYSSTTEKPTWISWLLIALGGGMILNLMPCVFPMIGIKILGFANEAGAKRKTVILHGLLYSLGVIISFIGLAILILILKQTGNSIGWGFQMQSPGFVVLTTILMVTLGWSLWGVFEIGLGFSGNLAQSNNSTGSWGAFLSGVLATAVATPCTAPGLGAAIGFALDSSRTSLETILLFIAIGIGMALPYLLLSLFPSLTRLLPKPGSWMETLKKIMAIPLFGYAGYLFWVLDGITDNSVWLRNVFIGIILISIACWIWGRWGALHRTRKQRLTAASVALIIYAITLGYLFSTIP